MNYYCCFLSLVFAQIMYNFVCTDSICHSCRVNVFAKIAHRFEIDAHAHIQNGSGHRRYTADLVFSINIEAVPFACARDSGLRRVCVRMNR